MKKLILAIMFFVLFFALPSFAQTIYNQSGATVAWDAVTSTVPGIVKYQPYSRSDLVSTGTKIGSEITTTNVVLTGFTAYTLYYIGVETVFYPTATPTVPTKSTTKAWSNNAADCSPAGPFGFLYSPGINAPGNLRFSLLGLLKSLVG